MDHTRRAFLKNTVLASSALAAAGKLSAQSSGSEFRRIAVEETFAIPELLDAGQELVRQDPDRRPSLVTPLEPEMTSALTDLGEGRIATMDEAHIDKQVLGLWSPGVQIFNPQLGTELARLVNDRLAEAIRRRPDRLAGLTTVATQDPEAAAQEAERGISSLGLNGVLINSHIAPIFRQASIHAYAPRPFCVSNPTTSPRPTPVLMRSRASRFAVLFSSSCVTTSSGPKRSAGVSPAISTTIS